MRSLLVALSLVLLAPAARAQTSLSVDGAASSITYHMVHKLHKFEGVSKKISGRAVIQPDGRAQVAVSAPAESFDSGNVNRDAHMKEAVEAARFPTIELKALGDGLTAPASFPSTVKKSFKVQLAFHGETKIFEIPVEVTWESADKVRAKSTFNVSLDAYKVERPSLMFVKVDDTMVIDADLRLKK
jgi:polyisoprenoid-binding protein YceI